MLMKNKIKFDVTYIDLIIFKEKFNVIYIYIFNYLCIGIIRYN